VAALTLASAPAWGEAPYDRFWAALEYFYPTIDSTIRFDATAIPRPGTEVRLEDELDLAERKGTSYVDLGMRLGERWRLELEYYSLERSATKALGREVHFGDFTFPLGADVDSRFDSTVYRLTGGWSFIKHDRGEAGVALGLHVTDFKVQLSGQGNDILAGVGFRVEERKQQVPLPTLGLFGSYVVTPQVLLRGRADYLSFNDGRYDGRLLNWLAAADWRFDRHIGAGLGYRYVDYKLRSTASDFTGEVRYAFRGPTIFVNVGF